jgi:plasmid maintenance system antidote protein VapI
MADFAPTHPGEILLTEFLDRWGSRSTGSPKRSKCRRGG